MESQFQIRVIWDSRPPQESILVWNYILMLLVRIREWNSYFLCGWQRRPWMSAQQTASTSTERARKSQCGYKSNHVREFFQKEDSPGHRDTCKGEDATCYYCKGVAKKFPKGHFISAWSLAPSAWSPRWRWCPYGSQCQCSELIQEQEIRITRSFCLASKVMAMSSWKSMSMFGINSRTRN